MSRSSPRHFLENNISNPTREECQEEASMGLGDIQEKEIEEKVKDDSPGEGEKEGCQAGSGNSGVFERVYWEYVCMCTDASWQNRCAAWGMTFLTQCDKAHLFDLFSYNFNMYPTRKTVFIVTDPKPIIFFLHASII